MTRYGPTPCSFVHFENHSMSDVTEILARIEFARPDQIHTEVGRVLASFGTPYRAPETTPDAPGPTHIFNLGHGISQYTPPDNVAALVAAVHEISRKMRA